MAKRLGAKKVLPVLTAGTALVLGAGAVQDGFAGSISPEGQGTMPKTATKNLGDPSTRAVSSGEALELTPAAVPSMPLQSPKANCINRPPATSGKAYIIAGSPDKTPNKAYIIAAAPDRAHAFPTYGAWTQLPDGTFEKKDGRGLRLILGRQGDLTLFGPDGALLSQAIDPAAGEVYKALVKSIEMLEKTGTGVPLEGK